MASIVKSLLGVDSDNLYTVASDLKLEESGTRFHFIPDPFDIISYCFPIDPGPSHRYDINIHTIADLQVAWSDVFYLHDYKPVLLDEYVYELQSIVTAIHRSYHRGHKNLELLDALRKSLDSVLLGPIEEIYAKDIITSIVADKYHIILALAFGIYKNEFKRLRDIFDNRLNRSVSDMESEYKPDSDIIENIFASAKGSYEIASEIETNLISKIDDLSISKSERSSKKRTINTDAVAVSRILDINKSLQYAHENGSLKNRHIYLYLSSTLRAKEIFNMDIVKDAQAEIYGQQYSLHRNAGQVLVKLISKSDTKDKAISTVEYMADMVENTRESVSFSSELAKSYGFNTKGYEKHLQKLEARAKNFGLVSLSQVDRYRAIIDHVRSLESDDRVIDVMDRIQDINYDIAQDKRETQFHLIYVKNVFGETLVRGLRSITEQYIEKPYLLRGKDPVVGTSHYMPTLVKVVTPAYQSIVDSACDFYRNPYLKDKERLAEFRSACEQFWNFDVTEVDTDLQHELVRGILFLALPVRHAELIAANHIEDLLEDETLEFEQNGGEWNVSKELRYVQCWALRRAKEYKRALECASDAIDVHGDDPRFWHGRSLVIYARFMDRRATRGGGTPRLELAVSDALKALELYSSQSWEEKEETVGVMHNTLAYLYCLEDTQDVEKAREHLDALVESVPIKHWEDKHPEYFHTAAVVSLREAQAYQEQLSRETSAGTRTILSQQVRKKIAEAKVAITEAFDIDPHDRDYRDLVGKIESLADNPMSIRDLVV